MISMPALISTDDEIILQKSFFISLFDKQQNHVCHLIFVFSILKVNELSVHRFYYNIS